MNHPIEPSTADSELIGRVVAWHNRRWFTRRIEARHVTGLGLVALPFAPAAAAGGTRAAGWLRRPPVPLFDDPLIPPLRRSAIAALARRHGVLERPGPSAWPLRRFDSASSDGADAQWRFLRTAAIELGPRRIRVLVGAEGAQAAVIGARFWNRQHLRRLLAGLTAGVALAFAATLTSQVVLSDPPAVASAAAPAAVAPEPAAESSDEVVDGAADAAASRTETDPPADAAVSEAPAMATPPAASAAPSAGGDGSTVYALATEPTRSRAGSLLRLMLMNAPHEPRADRAHAEVMRTAAGWRAVLWPYASPAAAEQARQALEQRGVRVELVAF